MNRELTGSLKLLKNTGRIFIMILLIFVLTTQTFGQDNLKKGGVCFRVDDNPVLARLNYYDSLFSKYQKNFSMAFTTWQFAQDSIYLQTLKSYIAEGNELMDQTPSHQTQMAYIGDDSSYSTDPAVDHITNKIACLKYSSIDTSTSHNEGLINIFGNLVISQLPGEFDDLDGNPYFYALYFESPINKVCLWYNLRKSNPADPDSVDITSFWQEPVDFDTCMNVKYHKLTRFDVTMNPASIRFLGKLSIKIYQESLIPKPRSWIHPAGLMPYFSEMELKINFGDSLGYSEGANYKSNSLLCYNEYNPFRLKQFGMQTGSISIENQSIQWNKHQISDYIAKHYTVIDVTNLYNPPGGFDVYWIKLDVILNWISQNNIPVKTYSQWKTILYDSLPNRFINPIPNLNIDLDGDNYPDGFYNHGGIASNYIKTDGVPSSGGCSFEIIGNGGVCQVPELAGFEKGTNNFSIWTKGTGTDTSYVTVEFYFPENGNSQQYNFPINSPVWMKYTQMITIPDTVSTMTISVYRQSQPMDTIKISGLELISTGFLKTVRYPVQVQTANNPFPPINLNALVIDSLCNPSTVSWTYHSNTSLRLEILPGNILKIQKPISFWVGKDSAYVVGINLEGIKDSCLISFRSLAIPYECSKIPIQLFLLDTLANDSIYWSSEPFDPSMNNPRIYNPVVAPVVTTLYRILAVNPSGNIFRDSIIVGRYPNPQPGLGNDTTLCLGKSILLKANGGIHFLWSTGDTTSSITVHPIVKTKYFVTVTNEYSCTGMDSIQVSVVQGPTVTLEGILPSYCKNDPQVTLFGKPFGGVYSGTSGLIGDTFYPELANLGFNQLMYSYADPQTHCGDTATKYVTIFPVPVINHLPDTSLCANYQIILHAGPGFDNYLWSNGAIDSTVVVDSTGHGLGPLEIWVYVTKDGCVARDTAKINFIICPIGINDLELFDYISLFPNPASEKLIINFISRDISEILLKIVDIKGEELTGKIILQKPNNNIDISPLQRGIYFLKIQIGKKNFTYKLIKQ